MSFTTYLALGSIADGAFAETSAGNYSRQMVWLSPRDAQGRTIYGGQLRPGTAISGGGPGATSRITFPASHGEGARALYADPTGGEPLAAWTAESNAAAPFILDGDVIGDDVEGPAFELVLHRFTGAPMARVAQA